MSDLISRYFPSLKRFQAYLPHRGNITEVFDLENDPRVDFLWDRRDFILRSTNEVLLHFDKAIQESKMTSLGHGFWILSVSYDSSRVGKDQRLVTTEVLFHKERGKYKEVTVEDASIIWGYRFLNCGLISSNKVFYDSISFEKVFELPAWIGWYGDFNENTKLAEFKICNDVLIRLVKGKVYCIVDVTGTDSHAWPIAKEMRHDTPILYPKGIDDNGVKVVPWEDFFFPTTSNQYVVGWKHITPDSGFDRDRGQCVVVNRLGEKICGCQYFDTYEGGSRRCLDQFLRAYNEYFYVFASAQYGYGGMYFVYNIYGDLIFNKECRELRLQDNLTFIVNFEYYGPGFLYNHKVECITPEGYSWLKDFRYERAFFVKDGKWGLLQYIFNDRVVELYVDGDNTYIECDYQNANPIVAIDGPYIEWRGVFYDMDLKKIEEKKPYSEMACGYGINGLYINGERVEMDDDITVTKSLGNGFFLGEYTRIGHFDTTGKIVDLEAEKNLPIVYPENVPQYKEIYQRKRLDHELNHGGRIFGRVFW